MGNEKRGTQNKKREGEVNVANAELDNLHSEFQPPNSPFQPQPPHSFDLKQRTFAFSLRVMRFAESLQNNRTGRTIANQVIRSGTSVGANYRAATRARSTKDFIAKLGIVEEECDETIYWIELAIAAESVQKTKVESLLKEANELLAITVASIKTVKQRIGRTAKKVGSI